MLIRFLARSFAALSFALCGALRAAAPAEVDGAYTVMLLGDTHFDAPRFHDAPLKGWRIASHGKCYKMWESRSQELLAAAGKHAAAERVAFAVQLGDLVNGDCDTPALLRKMIRTGFPVVKKYFPDIPLLVVKGNHDIWTMKKVKNNAAANIAWLPIISKELGFEVTGNGCYAFRRGDDLYMAVDGFIPAEDIKAFVKTTLEKNPKTRYVFFLSHLPLLPASLRYPFWLLPGHYEILEMLEKRNVLILSAHTHANSYAVRRTAEGELPQLIVTSLGSDWDPEHRTPPKFDSWESFSKASRARAVAGDRYNSPEMWEPLEKRGAYTFRELTGNSGFAVLDVDGDRVEVRYYTDDSGKPAATVRLPNKRKSAAGSPER